MEKIQLVYFIFLLIGGLGLLSSLIFGLDHDGDIGGDHDVSGHDGDGSDGPQIFSLRIIFAFLMAFGIGGGSMYLSNRGIGPQIVTGFLSGIGVAVLTFYMMKFLYSQQGNSNINSDNFIGKFAYVTIETAKYGSCQVKVDSGGGDQLFMAKEKNSEFLKQNDTVKIVGRLGNVLVVEKQTK
jgi:membrane protein implicated in regulation of membrane protease activity